MMGAPEEMRREMFWRIVHGALAPLWVVGLFVAALLVEVGALPVWLPPVLAACNIVLVMLAGADEAIWFPILTFIVVLGNVVLHQFLRNPMVPVAEDVALVLLALSAPILLALLVLYERGLWTRGMGPNRLNGTARKQGDFGVDEDDVSEKGGRDHLETSPHSREAACPEGGAHDWQLVGSSTSYEWPPGVDMCTENLIFVDEVESRTYRCARCGEERTSTEKVSSGMPVG